MNAAPDQLEARKDAARAWFESLQLRIIAAFEALEDEAPGPFAQDADEPGRFVLTAWSRTDHSGATLGSAAGNIGGAPGGGGRMGMIQGPRVRKGRRALLDGLWDLRARIRQADPGRGGRPSLFRDRHLADRASLEPKCSRRAYEHALRRDEQGVVWRRRRPDAGARRAPHAGRSRHDRLSRRDARRLRAPSGRRLCALQAMVR